MDLPFPTERTSDRWRWVLEDLKQARATQVIAGVVVLVHVFLVLASLPEIAARSNGLHSWRDLLGIPGQRPAVFENAYITGGLTRDSLLDWHVWQLLTYSLLHATFIHLLVNVLALLMAGLQLERIAGPRSVLKIFFGGVFCGGLAHVLLQPSDNANVTLVGASGGVAAMFFWLITISPDTRSRYLRVSWRLLGRLLLLGQAAMVAWMWLGNGSGGDPLGLQIGHACHLGGSLFGVWVARRTLRPTVTRKEILKMRARREARLLKARR